MSTPSVGNSPSSVSAALPPAGGPAAPLLTGGFSLHEVQAPSPAVVTKADVALAVVKIAVFESWRVVKISVAIACGPFTLPYAICYIGGKPHNIPRNLMQFQRNHPTLQFDQLRRDFAIIASYAARHAADPNYDEHRDL